MNKSNCEPTQEESEDYFIYNESIGGKSTVTNKDLICKDCRYATESVLTCKMYRVQKPGTAFYGYCKDYEPK